MDFEMYIFDTSFRMSKLKKLQMDFDSYKWILKQISVFLRMWLFCKCLDSDNYLANLDHYSNVSLDIALLGFISVVATTIHILLCLFLARIHLSD